MKKELKRRILQFGQQARRGDLGNAAQTSAEKYDKINFENMDPFIKLITDFYGRPRKTGEDVQIANLAERFARLLIVAYRDASRQDPQVGFAFANSFIEDFPGAPETCIYPQWESLAKASLAFENVSASENPLLIWQQSLKLVQAYNEFLNALLGHMIIAWRTALGKSHNINVFNNAYGSKLHEFAQLTGGDDGAFYLFPRLANVNLRNAIAHEDIWLDKDSGIVHYTAGKNPKQTYQIPIADLFGYATIGSHLCEAFLVAIASIIVLEDGSVRDKSKIPDHLSALMAFDPAKKRP